MHWISLIGFFIIVYICQAQPTIFENFETRHLNKDGTFEVASDSENAHVSGWENTVDDSVIVSTSNAPLQISIKHEKDIEKKVKVVASSGINNQCYIILPFIIVAFMGIVHF